MPALMGADLPAEKGDQYALRMPRLLWRAFSFQETEGMSWHGSMPDWENHYAYERNRSDLHTCLTR